MARKYPPLVTVRQGALIVGRDVSRIYHWIAEERITTQSRNGVTTLNTSELLELESIMTRRTSFTNNTPTV